MGTPQYVTNREGIILVVFTKRHVPENSLYPLQDTKSINLFIFSRLSEAGSDKQVGVGCASVIAGASRCLLTPALTGMSCMEGKMKNLLLKLWKDEEGQDLTEYALLLVLLTLAAIGSLGALANAVNGVFNRAAGNLVTPT
jgi:pilus assembly protein Flp/PilA